MIMGKKAEKNTLVHKPDSVALEQTSVYDDSLLPPAEELARLKEIDPGLINWILKRTEIEQDARIKFNMDKIGLMKKDMNQVTAQNVFLVSCVFIMLLAAISLSAYFVYSGKDVTGTIFGGSSILLAAVIFVRWQAGSKPQQ